MITDGETEEKFEYIGPLTNENRLAKVRQYLLKKYNKFRTAKHTYVCRKNVANKRLRIKGRFVTKEQAFEILSLTEDQLLDIEKLQEMLTSNSENPIKINSLIEYGSDNTIKV